MELELKNLEIECMKLDKKIHELNVWIWEKNPKIGCMELEFFFLEIECMKWEFKSNI